MTSLPERPGVRFLPLKSISGYVVGDDGSVWSGLGTEWRELSIHTRPDSGYKTVSLRLNRGRGKVVVKYVHRLVCEVFIGPIPKGHHCCHWNGDRGDNRFGNLRIDTPSANAKDRARHGTVLAGSNHPRAIFSRDDIRTILSMSSKGKTQCEIATHLRVQQTQISAVLRGKIYRQDVDAIRAES